MESFFVNLDEFSDSYLIEYFESKNIVKEIE